MEVDNLNSDVAKELLNVLYYCDNEFVDNIPDTVLINIRELAAQCEKEYYLEDKPLVLQNLSEECKNYLAVLYFRYCLDESKRQEVLNLLETN